jgi:hypothetical protein
MFLSEYSESTCKLMFDAQESQDTELSVRLHCTMVGPSGAQIRLTRRCKVVLNNLQRTMLRINVSYL